MKFNCVCVCENNQIIGFAGVYEETPSDANVKIFKLAHLLVDVKKRGRGLGTILEDCRLDMVEKSNSKKVIYASCVENPRNSIHMKLNRGFYINGFKFHYRTIGERKDNALILVKSCGMDKLCNMSIDIDGNISLMTKKILSRGNSKINYVDKYCEEDIKNFKFESTMMNDKKLERVVRKLENTYLATDMIYSGDSHEILNDDFDCYSSVVVSPNICGFSTIDKYLIQNQYYPVSYIPYINDFYGEIEYQYLNKGLNEILDNQLVSNEGKDFLLEII